MTALPGVDRPQVLAFRLAGHGLARRLTGVSPCGGGVTPLLEAAARCGLQDTPPGSAELALGARVEPDEARAELVRRYLRSYGPSTARHFAEWAGISPKQADRAWKLVDRELAEVDFAGRRVWLCERDMPDLMSPPDPTGVRLLPPHDAYLNQRDRETLVPDGALRRRLWRAIGNPGVVLVDGQVAGTWRPRKRGDRLTITVESFAPLAAGAREETAAEADLIGALRECAVTEVLCDPS